MLILKAIDKYHENSERRARERAEWEAASRAKGRAEGHAQGRAEGRAQLLDQLRERGYNVDDLLPPDESDTEPPATP